MDIQYALVNPPTAPDHVLPGLLAGSVGMLVGPGGVGKTMLELQIAVALALGLPPLDGAMGEWCNDWDYRSPQRVTLVFAEEPYDVVCRRLHLVVRSVLEDACKRYGTPDEVLLVLKKNLTLFPLGGEHRLTLMSDKYQSHEHLHKLEEACKGTRLLILDPIRQLHQADENDSTAMNALVQLLHGVAHRTRTAIVFSHHTSRAAQFGTGAEATAARGSTALRDGVRWQLNMSKPPSPSRREMLGKSGKEGSVVYVDLSKQNHIESPPGIVMRLNKDGLLFVPMAPKIDGKPRPTQAKNSVRRSAQA